MGAPGSASCDAFPPAATVRANLGGRGRVACRQRRMYSRFRRRDERSEPRLAHGAGVSSALRGRDGGLVSVLRVWYDRTYVRGSSRSG
jgi:hypothetical protein